MRIKVLILLIIGFIFVLPEQLIAQKETNIKNYEQKLEFAKELIFIKDYKNAYLNLLELYQEDSTVAEINYYLGYASFYSNRDKTIALPYLRKGVKFNGNAYYFIGLIYHQQEKFDQAKLSFDMYRSLVFEEKIISNEQVLQEIRKIKTAKKLILNTTKLKVENLGREVNSAYPDYAPLLYANGNRMFYTSRREGLFPNKKDPNNEFFEDIYYTEKVNDAWVKGENIGTPLNSETHDATVSISFDEKTLYLYRTNPNMIGGDILKSNLEDGKWSEPVPFESTINTKAGSESSISIHPDGSKIYFSSNRKGGYGGKDIYCIKRLPNGKWSLPSNLGGMVNTAYDEDAPFISSDGVTLYFASKGHENMGGYDLFKTVSIGAGVWSEPKNLGYPVNSVKDDIFLSTVDDKNYFFSSNRNGGYGFSDIYHSIFPKKKNKHLLIKGRVINDKNQNSLRASITLFNKSNNKLKGLYKSDQETGMFIMIIEPGEKYKMFVEAKGYYSQTIELDFSSD
jgi:hypothetical protein